MKLKLLIALSLISTAAAHAAVPQIISESLSANPSSANVVVNPGAVIYKIPADTSAQNLKSLNALLNSQGLISSKTLEGSKIVVATFAHHGREQAIANIIKRSGLVEFAEPDFAMEPTSTPNDTYFSNQWHHTTVNSQQAWDITTGSQSVLTAVCDSGFDAEHPDLFNNLRLDLAYNAQDNSDYIFDADGHGTGTAGTLGAVGNNNIGVAGVNWDIDIIPIRIAISDTNSSAYISTMATCIEYAADQGARVVNLSYGGIQYATIDAAAQYLRSKNGLLFMSAGNDGQEFSYPDYTSFIGVGATDRNNNRASFSSWGNYVDITAPGVDIATTYPENRYVYYSGTSFSSPLTAGIAALMVAANPSITVSEIENGLFSTSTDIGAAGDDNVFGHGLVNAQAAVNYAKNLSSQIAPIADISASSTSLPFGDEVVLSANNSSDADGDIVSYAWSLGDGTTSSNVTVNHIYAQAGSYQVNLTVTDNDGLTDSTSTTIQITTELPTAVIDSMPLIYNLGEATYFNGLASFDTDGVITTYSWEFGDGNSATGGTATHTYTAVGDYTARLTVTDNAGAMNTAEVVVSIVDPFVLNAPSNLTGQANGFEVQLSWSDNSTNEDSFIVERGVKFRGRTNFVTIATLVSNSTNYKDVVDEKGDYSYRVTAVNSSNSATSQTIKVTVDDSVTSPEPGELNAPTNLAASLSGTSVSLTWSDNSTDELGFYIERGIKTRGRTNFEQIGQVSQDTTTFVDSVSGLPNGNYVYRVQAYNDAAVSGYTNTAEVRVK